MPEAILLEDVDKLGEKGAVVDVSKGYLRNFLIPRNLAAPATRAPSRPPASVSRSRSAPPATRSSGPTSTPTC